MSVLEAPFRGNEMTLYTADIKAEIDDRDDVNTAPDSSGDSSITDFSDISDREQQGRERLRKLNRERVRRYRLRHRKGANDHGKVSEAANNRKRIAGKAKLRTSTSSQQQSQQTFFSLIFLSIIFLLVVGASVRCYSRE